MTIPPRIADVAATSRLFLAPPFVVMLITCCGEVVRW